MVVGHLTNFYRGSGTIQFKIVQKNKILATVPILTTQYRISIELKNIQ